MFHPLLIILTGLSGSGKSSAMKVIEDAGYFCMDNVPLDIMIKLIEISEFETMDVSKLCLGVDVRSGASRFVEKSVNKFSYMRDTVPGFKLIFLDSEKDQILHRFKETRRRHPLSDQYPNLMDAIDAEAELMAPVKEMADIVINTSKLNVHELKSRIEEMIASDDQARQMLIEIRSFGFKYGAPVDADIVMDVRFLPNPYFVSGLKEKTGRDREVKEFLEQQPEYIEFTRRFEDLIDFMLPLYKREGRAYLNIAVGCTGGRHRSVAVAEAINNLVQKAGFTAKLKHREIGA